MGGSEIPLCNPSGEKLLLRPFLSYNKLLGRVAFRSSSAKIASNLNTLTIFAKKKKKVWSVLGQVLINRTFNDSNNFLFPLGVQMIVIELYI